MAVPAGSEAVRPGAGLPPSGPREDHITHMGGPVGITFTDRELEVMNILWDKGSATVNEAREVIGKERPYTSVLTVFQVLEEKGHVDHEREGKAYRYYPKVERSEAGDKALSYVLENLFKGSPAQMMTSLLRQEGLGEDDRKRLQDMLDEADDS